MRSAFKRLMTAMREMWTGASPSRKPPSIWRVDREGNVILPTRCVVLKAKS